MNKKEATGNHLLAIAAVLIAVGALVIAGVSLLADASSDPSIDSIEYDTNVSSTTMVISVSNIDASPASVLIYKGGYQVVPTRYITSVGGTILVPTLSKGSYSMTIKDGTTALVSKSFELYKVNLDYSKLISPISDETMVLSGDSAADYELSDLYTWFDNPSKTGDPIESLDDVEFVDNECTLYAFDRTPVTVKANDASKIYDEDDPEFTAVITPEVTGLVFDFERAEGEDVGTYTITPIGDTSQGIYIITFETGVLTIEPKEVSVPEVEIEVVAYDGAEHITDIPDGDYYTVTQATGTAVGVYKATLVLNDKANYVWETGTTDDILVDALKIITIPEFVAPTAKDLVYTGEEQELVNAGESIEVTGEFTYSLEEEGTYSETIPTGVDAGLYTVWYKFTPDDPEYATVSGSVPAAIAKATIDSVTVDPSSVKYDGEDHIPVTANVTAKAGDLADTDKTIIVYASFDGEAFSDPVDEAIDAGDYYVVVIPSDNFKLQAEIEEGKTYAVFTITEASPAEWTTPPTGIDDFVYDGEEYALVEEGTGVPSGGDAMYSLDGIDFSEDVPIAKDAGEYTVYFYVKGDDDHTDSPVGNFTVTVSPRSIAGVVIILGDALTYNGEEQTQAIESVKVGDLDVTYDLSDNTGTDAGEYELTVTAKGNFTGYAKYPWSIAKATIDSVTIDPSSAEYDGENHIPDAETVTAKAGDLTDAGKTIAVYDSMPFTDPVDEVIEVGKYYVVVIPSSNFKLQAETEEGKTFAVFSITTDKQASWVTKPTAEVGLKYNGGAQWLVKEGYEALNGTPMFKVGESGMYTTTATATDAGDYEVFFKVKGNSGYADSDEESFIVSIAKLPASWTINPEGAGILIYTGEDQKLLKVDGTPSGGKAKYSLNGIDFVDESPSGKDAGLYKVYYYVEGDTNHISTEVLYVDVPILGIAAGKLHDTSDYYTDDQLCDGYVAEIEDFDEWAIYVTVSGENLKAHQNGQSKMGYWAGFAVPVTPYGTTVAYMIYLDDELIRDGSYDLKDDPEYDGTVNHPAFVWYPNLLEGAEYEIILTFGGEFIETFEVSFDISLQEYDVTFNGNGATSGEMEKQSFVYGVKEELSVNEFYRTGYLFQGWSTEPDGEIKYVDEDDFILTNRDGVTLYAIWSQNIAAGKLHDTSGYYKDSDLCDDYKATIGDVEEGVTAVTVSGKDLKAHQNGQSKMGYWAGFAVVKVPYGYGPGTVVEYEISIGGKTLKDSYTLSADPASEDYYDGTIDHPAFVFYPNVASYTECTITLTYDDTVTEKYAVSFDMIMQKYNVTFNGSGATSGEMEAQSFLYNETKELSANQFSRAGYLFQGWALTEGGAKVYDDKQDFTMTDLKGVTLYAVWCKTVDIPNAVEGLEYDGTEKIGVLPGEEYTLTGATAVEAGDYIAKATLKDGYVWSGGSFDPVEINWTIAPKKVAVPEALEKTFTYNGVDQTYVPTGFSSEIMTIEDNVQKNAGSYVVKVALKDTKNYQWSNFGDSVKTYDFVIEKAPLAVNAKDYSVKFGEEPPVYEADYVGLQGGDTKDVVTGLKLDCSYKAGDKVGEYAIKASGAVADNYTITMTDGKLTVGKAVAKVTVAPEPTNPVYTGSELELVTAGLSDDGTVKYKIGEEGTYSESIPTGIDVGNYKVFYKVFATDKDNYEDSSDFEVPATIKKAPSVWTKEPAAASSLVYNGESQGLFALGEASGGTAMYRLGETGKYGTEVLTAVDAGTYTVWYFIAGDSNHEDCAEKSMDVVIGQRDLSNSMVTVSGEYTYNGNEQTVSYTVSDKSGDKEIITIGDYTVSGSTGKDAKDYTLTVTAKAEGSNYKGSVSKTWTIAPKQATVKADDKDMKIGEDLPELTATLTGFIGSDVPEYQLSTTATKESPKGTYPITATGEKDQGNYIVTFVNATLTISDSGTSEAVVVPMSGLVYDGTAQGLINTETTWVIHGTLQYSLDGQTYSADIPTAVTAGEHKVYWKTVPDEGYSPTSGNVNAVIAKADLTVTVSIDSWDVKDTPSEPSVVCKNQLGKDVTSYVTGVTYTYFSGDIQLESKPTEIGSYKVIANVPTADDYNSAVSEPCPFSIVGYEERTVSDATGKISAKGHIAEEAVLKVTNDYDPADWESVDLSGKDILRTYDIWLESPVQPAYTGVLEVTLTVGSAYDGSKVTVYHHGENGVESFVKVVRNGQVTVPVTDLSPFIATTSSSSPSGGSDGSIVVFSSDANMTVLLAFATLTLSLIGLAVVIYKRK